MRWSVDPPHDPVLLGDERRAGRLLVDLTVSRVLRHRPGVRLDLAVVSDGRDGRDGRDGVPERATVSIHGIRHAVAEARRVRAWHDAGVGDLVPAWATVADAGRVGLTAWVDGRPLDALDDGAFVLAAWSAGETLAALHRSPAELDRTVPATVVAELSGRALPAVPTLGGASPASACVQQGITRWFDVGGSVCGPAALDVGRFVHELRARSSTGAPRLRDRDVTDAAVDAFLDGYGDEVPGLEVWLTHLDGARQVAPS